jgi:hypothetical protein
MRRIHGQLSQPSYIKAPKENRNYIQEPRPCASRNRQKPPSPAVVKLSPAVVVEEDAMATLDLEEPHRPQALKRAAVATRREGRD